VARISRWVRIDLDAIPAYARSLAGATFTAALDPETHFLGERSATAGYVLTLEAVNFGSGYFPHLRRRDRRSGYFHVARALKERWEQHGPMTPAELASVEVEDCRAIFEQPAEGPAGELMELFASALNAFGRHLIDHHRGSFEALLEAAGGSAERLAGLLAEVPLFDDVHQYRRLTVPLYKRAQIAPADLQLAIGGFQGLDRLTIFADNLVPHVLHLDGVLAFDEVLAERIDREELLTSGSEEEVEMRACSVHAVELIKAAVPGRTAMELDHLLWNRGQGAQYTAHPRPRCRSVYY
jgi:hypothetical protein